MHREKIITLLEKYIPFDEKESKMHQKLLEFVRRVSDCFDNYYPEGHIVAGAWVLDKEKSKVGLVHHGKIQKWFQPGGHSDGNSDTPQEALREAVEELGVDSLKLASGEVFWGFKDAILHELFT